MKDYYIKTKDLSVGYQGKVLIRDINLDIKKGEIVTLIGPNGAGKTTLMRLICGVLHSLTCHHTKSFHHIKERYQTVETDRRRSLSRFR